MQSIQALAVAYGPYLIALVAYQIIVGGLHALLTWLTGATFATNWPRLSHFMASTGLNLVGVIQALLGAIPAPKPTVPAAPKVPPLPVFIVSIAFVFGGLLALAMFTAGCSSATQQKAKTIVQQDVEPALRDVDRICIEAQVLFGVSEPAAIRVACGIVDVADDVLEREIGRHVDAVALMVKNSLAKPGSKPAVCGP